MTAPRPAFQVLPLGRGVTLHFRRSDAFKTELVRLFFRRPLDDARTLRQLYAAMLSRGTRTLPTRRLLAARLQELYGAGFGASAQRMAGRQVLALRASTVSGRFLPGRPQNLGALLDFLADALAGPALTGGRLDPDFFEQERRSLLRDLRARVNNKGRYAHLRLQEEMFPGHPLGQPDCGTEAEILAATSEACLEEGLRTCREGELDIYLLAPCRAAEAERLVLRRFHPAERTRERHALPGLPEPRSRCRTVRERMDVVQARLAAGFRIAGWRRGESRFAAALADAILGGGTASKLFRNVREKRSLCYDVRSHFDSVAGTLTVAAGTAPRHAGDALRAIRQEVLAMAQGRVTTEEMATARAALDAALQEIGDSQSGLVDFFYFRRLLGRPETSIEDLRRRVRAVGSGRIPALMDRAVLDTVFMLESTTPAEAAS